MGSCNSCDDGAREISVVSSSHLLHMGYLLEMADTNALVLRAITRIHFIGAQQLFTPLEGMVKEELNEGMQDLPYEEDRRVREPPVTPKGELNTVEVGSLCSGQELLETPRIQATCT